MALADIIARKRVDVATRQSLIPESTLRLGLGPSDRSLKAALRREHTSFILECKKGSPSKGIIRPQFNLDEIASAYAPFADAISVITDEPFFGGRLEYISGIRNQVTQPVLCKDFVVDPYQVVEARWHGADAILLMLSVLDDAVYANCARIANELNMDVLTEVHDQDELERAHQLGAAIIGINNRNLATLKVDMQNTKRLAQLVEPDRLVVCESGIHDHKDIILFRDKVDGFLVGSSLMARPDLDQAVRELIFGRTKVCGLTNPEAARLAYNSGACWGGVIFYSGSPRAVSVLQAQKSALQSPNCFGPVCL